MATWEDVERLARGLPQTSEGTRWNHRTWFVAEKGFVWERPLSKKDRAAIGRPTWAARTTCSATRSQTGQAAPPGSIVASWGAACSLSATQGRSRGRKSRLFVRGSAHHETWVIPAYNRIRASAQSVKLVETAGIEPASAIAHEWRLRAYPALCSRPGVASPAGFSGTSLLKMSPVWRRRAAPG